MIVLGLDPGATTGWARVLLEYGKRPKVLDCGTFRAPTARVGGESFAAVLKKEEPCTVFAVETLAGIAFPTKGGGIVGSLIAAAKVEERLRCYAERFPHGGVHDLTAHQWRQALCGKRAATSHQIADALALRVQMPKRTNEHVRDAIGIAVALPSCVPSVFGVLVNEKRQKELDEWNRNV